MTPYELGVAMGMYKTGAVEKDAGLMDFIRKLFGLVPAAARGSGRIARRRRVYTAAERAPLNIRKPAARAPLIDVRGIPTRQDLRRAIMLGTLGGGVTTAGALGLQRLR